MNDNNRAKLGISNLAINDISVFTKIADQVRATKAISNTAVIEPNTLFTIVLLNKNFITLVKIVMAKLNGNKVIFNKVRNDI